MRHEERVRELAFFSLQKRRLREIFLMPLTLDYGMKSQMEPNSS